jgi:hypothetical protein
MTFFFFGILDSINIIVHRRLAKRTYGSRNAPPDKAFDTG